MSHLNVHLGSVADLGTRNREVRFTAITDISDPRISIRFVPRANVAKIY
jgi:hypothetical protein